MKDEPGTEAATTPMAEAPEPCPSRHFPSLLAMACFVIIVAGMRAAAGILSPLLLALFIAVVSAAPFHWLRRHGVSAISAIALLVVALVAAILVSGAFIGMATDDVLPEIPRYQERIEEKIAVATNACRRIGLNLPEDAFTEYFDPGAVMQLAAASLMGLGTILTNALLILFTVALLLVEAASFPRKLATAFNLSHRDHEAIIGTVAMVNRYLAIKTAISLATGVAVALWLGLLGIGHPVLWGMVAFLLNYIPNLGSIIAAVPVVLLSLVDAGTSTALLVGAGYLGINVLLGNVLEPYVMGRGLSLSMLVVFVSLIFWGWVLGPAGVLLSAPLTMIFKIVCEAFPETRWIAVMLSTNEDLHRHGHAPHHPAQG
jgi:predicted PurR-regulated permease PerM